MKLEDRVRTDLSQANQKLEAANNLRSEALEDEVDLNEENESYFEEVEGYLEGELHQFESNLVSAAELVDAASGADELEEFDETVQEAGQSLVNAYSAAEHLYSMTEDVMAGGNEGLSDEIVLGSLSDMDYIDALNKSRADKEEAFDSYQQLLDRVVSEGVEIYSEDGLVTHIDVGRGSQEAEEYF